ncbi:MAG: hypothetical protein KME45_01745 [Stenomitos rutilans HA7619-LM2]|jgi:hypothetical protein|nr:hypothetical protein [Stenomitos rutilans HA7619-LM2]
MKILYSAIVASVVFASITAPALQARADDDVRSGAWNEGRAAGKACAVDSANCRFDNPYLSKPVDEDSGETESDKPDSESQALSSADYIAGFIVGKSEASNK